MKTGRRVTFLSVLLLAAVLVLGGMPAAYADHGACPSGVCNGGLGCACGCGSFGTAQGYSGVAAYSAPAAPTAAPLVNTAPAEDPYADTAAKPVEEAAPANAALEQAFEDFLTYSSAAELEHDLAVKRELYREAERVWNEYLEMAALALEPAAEELAAESVDMNALRDEAFSNSLMYAMAAEEQYDPDVKRELYLEAARIWGEYQEMVLAMEQEAEAAVEEAVIEEAVDEAALMKELRESALEGFQLYSEAAERETDPYVKRELYAEAERIWEAYLELVSYDIESAYDYEYLMPYEDSYSIYDDFEEYDYDDLYPYGVEDYSAHTDPAFWQDDAEAEPAYRGDVYPDNWQTFDQEKSDALLAAILNSFETYAEPTPAPAEPAVTENPAAQTEPAVTENAAPAEASYNKLDDIAGYPYFFGMPNPWKETQWLEEAVKISGVDVTLPEGESLPKFMQLYWYQAVPGTLEADYYDGNSDLMIRASLDDEGYVLSGDYNVYSHTWQEKLGDVTVDCYGDGKTANLACFKKGDVAFAVSMNIGKEGMGLAADELAAIVEALCPAAGETAPAEDASQPTESAVITSTDVLLGTEDPALTNAIGEPVRLVCKAETNLGDFCADAYRVQGNADIGLVNSGGLNGSIGNGVITYDDILNTNPYGDTLCVAEVTGQQLLNALEWACRMVPEVTGSFYQVSGLQFEIHSYLPSPCLVDMNGNFVAIMGERRVQNVLVGGEPLDLEKTYTVAASDYVLLSGEDGNAALADAKLLKTDGKLDVQLLVDYIIDDLHGVIGQEYADLNGQGRIILVDTEPQPEQTEEEDPAMPDPMQRNEGKRPHFDGKKQ